MFCCWPLTPLHSLRPVMRGNDWRKKEEEKKKMVPGDLCVRAHFEMGLYAPCPSFTISYSKLCGCKELLACAGRGFIRRAWDRFVTTSMHIKALEPELIIGC